MSLQQFGSKCCLPIHWGALHHNNGGWVTVKLKVLKPFVACVCLFMSVFLRLCTLVNLVVWTSNNIFLFVQLWDLDNILQGSRNTPKNEAGVVDSDDDEMDVDNDPSKFTKGMVWFAPIDVNVTACLLLKTWYDYWETVYVQLNFTLWWYLCRGQEKECK